MRGCIPRRTSHGKEAVSRARSARRGRRPKKELKSTNEELQSTNEELQSTNEELTTSKEELQSLNEELQTLNHELQSKVDERSQSNNDMKNLLNSTDIATLFLDSELRVRRFTTQTARIVKSTGRGTIGGPSGFRIRAAVRSGGLFDSGFRLRNAEGGLSLVQGARGPHPRFERRGREVVRHRDRRGEHFLQAPQAIDRRRGGLGLGLAVVRGIVELHGGDVAVSSEGAGTGTAATVRLPATVLRPAQCGAAPADPAPAPASKRRVLVVDDNVDAADSLEQVLALGAHDVRVAYDGVSALHIAKAFAPEVVICDIGLPGMDGYEVARRLRGDVALRRSYLIAVSGYARPEDRRQSELAGFDQHIAKPPNLDALERMIAEAPRP